MCSKNLSHQAPLPTGTSHQCVCMYACMHVCIYVCIYHITNIKTIHKTAMRKIDFFKINLPGLESLGKAPTVQAWGPEEGAGYAHKKLSQHCSPVSPELGGSMETRDRWIPGACWPVRLKQWAPGSGRDPFPNRRCGVIRGKMRQAKFRLSQVHRKVHTYATLYTFIRHTCAPHSINFTW